MNPNRQRSGFAKAEGIWLQAGSMEPAERWGAELKYRDTEISREPAIPKEKPGEFGAGGLAR